MKGFIGGALLTLTVAGAPDFVVAPVDAQTLSVSPQAAMAGAGAWSALVGNTISGTTADGPYTEFFGPDGTAIHVDGDGREAGSWTRADTRICLSFPTDPDEHAECRGVEVQGTHGAFIDADGSRYPFDILPGNAKHL